MPRATLPALLGGCLAAYPWQTDLRECWTDPTCNRALVVSHGGAPDYVTRPYDSLSSFERAVRDGADAIKGDFRVTKDNVGMVMHSSPIELWESLNCAERRVEEMTEAECKSCDMLPTYEKFLSVPELLAWAEGTAITMLCVKEARDIPRAISTLVEQNATTRAFLEIRVGHLQEVLEKRPQGWDQVYYLAEMGKAADLDVLLADAFAPLLPRLFAFEFDPSWASWGLNVTDVIAQRLHPAGVRSLVATSKFVPSKQQHLDLYHDGFDIAYTYGTENAVAARTQINWERGLDPAALV